MGGDRVTAAPRSAASLPTLVLGRDRLPTSCRHCGSERLEQAPPRGSGQRGEVWCLRCTRSLCWLAESLHAARSGGVATLHVPARRPILAADFARLPGCGPRCTAVYGHDPLAHEMHGADAVYATIRSRRSGDVATGPLLVQLGPSRVYVAQVEVRFPHYEFELLAHLAERLGDVCTTREITAGVWDQTYASAAYRDAAHTTRVYMARIRQKLGQAGRLIETEFARGYRLADEPLT